MADIRKELSAALVARFHDSALEFADVAREIITRAWHTGFTVERKRDGSFVTDTDLEVEDRLRALITKQYPDHGILGEEFPPTRASARFQWILDPIDGTEDYVHRVPTFGSILALHYDGVPLVGVVDHPLLDLRCHAAYDRGTYRNTERVTIADIAPDTPPEQVRVVLSARANFIRYRDEGAYFDALTRAYPNHRIYRSCYGHALVATGAVDAMVDYHDAPWDLAASRILVEEAGGIYRIVRQFVVEGVPICSAVFGKRTVVERLCTVLDAR
jgi:histidinol-phosphatase